MNCFMWITRVHLKNLKVSGVVSTLNTSQFTTIKSTISKIFLNSVIYVVAAGFFFIIGNRFNGLCYNIWLCLAVIHISILLISECYFTSFLLTFVICYCLIFPVVNILISSWKLIFVHLRFCELVLSKAVWMYHICFECYIEHLSMV